MQFPRRDLQITHRLIRAARAHFGPMRPEGGGAAKRREQRLITGKRAEQRAGKLNLATPPGGKPASPIGHERAVTGRANAMPGLTDRLVIDAEDEIGMRNLAAKLALFLFCQITPVALILDHLQRAAWPAPPDSAPHLAGHAPGGARRGPSPCIHRNSRAIAAAAAQTITVQIARFRRFWCGGILWPALFCQPEDAAGIGMIVIGLQPRGQLAVA